MGSQIPRVGRVYLVGAGPGAPDLLTVRAARLLERAEIVFHDALVHPETVALAACAKKVAVGKRCSRISTDQRFINRCLIEAAQKYGVVVRLKGGDPTLFGRAAEEIGALERAGVPYEVVPGVTAALAGAAELGISLTERGVARTVTIATPRIGAGEHETDWAMSVANADTAVLYMGVGQAAGIAAALIAQGLPPQTPVVVVESASLPRCRKFAFTLAELPKAAEQEITGPALIMLGAVFRRALPALAGELETLREAACG
jgi:uroporphyrin-III C-methyltransferase